MIFAVPLAPTTSSCSSISTGNGDLIAIQPATGAVPAAVARGSENTTSVMTPFATAIVRSAVPPSDTTLMWCSAAASPSMTTGDTPRGRPSTSTRAPVGSVTIDKRPGAGGVSVARFASALCGTFADVNATAGWTGASAAEAVCAFGNHARTAPKLAIALINTIAVISSDVDPSADVAVGAD